MRRWLLFLSALLVCYGSRRRTAAESRRKVGPPRRRDRRLRAALTTRRQRSFSGPIPAVSTPIGVEPRFAPLDQKPTAAEKEKQGDVWSSHYSTRTAGLSPEEPSERERVRGGYDLTLLQRVVDQFVIHFDVGRHQPELLRNTTGQARAERSFHARSRRHDLSKP